FAHIIGASGDEAAIFRLDQKGYLYDVNCRVLADLSAVLRSHFPGYDIELLVQPGDTILPEDAGEHPAVLRVSRPLANGEDERALAVPPEIRAQTERLLRNCFAISKPNKDGGVIELVSRLDEAIIEQATHSAYADFHRSLELKLHLVDADLRYLTATAILEP